MYAITRMDHQDATNRCPVLAVNQTLHLFNVHPMYDTAAKEYEGLLTKSLHLR